MPSFCGSDDVFRVGSPLERLWSLIMGFDEVVDSLLQINDLANALVALQDRPWSEWRKAKPLTANALSRLLELFSIVPGSISRRRHWHLRATSASNSKMYGSAMPLPLRPIACFEPPQTTRCGILKMAGTSTKLPLVADGKGVTPAHRCASHGSTSKSESQLRLSAALTGRKFKGEI